MNVGELKALLANVPDHLEVSSEGCDCVDRAVGIMVDDTECMIARELDSCNHIAPSNIPGPPPPQPPLLEPPPGWIK